MLEWRESILVEEERELDDLTGGGGDKGRARGKYSRPA